MKKHQSIYFEASEWRKVREESERLEVSASEIFRRMWSFYQWNAGNIPNRNKVKAALSAEGLLDEGM